MKKALLILLLAIISNNIFAGGIIGNWRWRDNNGGEKTATWKADQNKAITIPDTQVIRLRIALTNTDGTPTLNPELEYSTQPKTGFVVIKNNNQQSTDAFVYTGNNVYVKNLQPTTVQIPSDTGRFMPGVIITVTDTAAIHFDNPTLETYTTEFEFVIKPGKYVKPGTTYYFTSNHMNSLGGAANFPLAQLTTANDILHPGDVVTGYNISPPSGNTITLKFTTALAGHNHFELQYSKDGLSWATYKTIPGDNLFQHQTTFTKPASQGTTIYGRIALFDLDNNMSVTPGKVIAATSPGMTGVQATDASILSVYPNPADGNVNYALKGYAGKTFTATLTNLYGKHIDKQTMTTNTAGHYLLPGTINPGTYILNISGDKMAKSIRVMVQ